MNESSSELMPREKLLKFGAEALSDAELLAIFLRTGIKGIPVMDLSESVLTAFGSLRGLLSATLEDFCKIKGLGQIQYIQLQATKEMTKRYLSQQMKVNEMVDSPYLAVMYFQSELESWEREVFMVIFLDNQNRLIKTEKMFYGTINQASVHPREIIKEALKCNAAAILVAHNHPSGNCNPSEADRFLTRKIEMACDLVDIRFVDHIIVGKGDYFSFEEEKFEQENYEFSPCLDELKQV
ncbi:JAB domain-containing protein [Glaesserella parasuis]|uniref:DNA repair protein RadC n=1 Tax=Glaesserella parasuis ZJ0906 TaxID=1322346 RepID=A0A806J5X6_GLAPU|nr:DNA repair protein RadC [Glaesserella parasuis]AGO16874.1 DNA repair protein RadC [Glaesserella parasuis ZJ0906]MCT8607917.1 DNA repair protein RadC [Glaesserella parasuis]MCT8775446.1 DNA repair protein RadC [Glaesserella parasuis]MCT8783770.1 DNA repair protein RadC [Glaesserella parasuis]MDD2164018.1 DNA repair protein RadC [Glaesserella parasuis]